MIIESGRAAASRSSAIVRPATVAGRGRPRAGRAMSQLPPRALARPAIGGMLAVMIGLRVTRPARLLLLCPALVACVFDGTGSTVGAGESTSAAGTTSTASTSSGSTAELTTSAGSTSTPVEPMDTGTGTTTSAAEPETTSTGSTTGTSAETTTGTTGEDVQALSFEDDIQPIFSDHCTCHGDGDPSPHLGAGTAYDSIVGWSSKDVKWMRLVQPGSPDKSYLWHKIVGTQDEVGGEGKRMPPNDPLLDDDIALIEQWIVEGAPP